MQIALISDIHSNLEALEAALKDMPSAPIYCLGDLVGYGADPNEVIRLVRGRQVSTVMGNHDYAVLTGDTEWFNENAAAAVEWTRGVIGTSERRYLSTLPQKQVVAVEGFKILMVHGSPTDPLFEYVDPSTHEHLFEAYLKKLDVDAVAMGHTHIPFIWEGGEGTVLNPGSVGQPRSGNQDASYMILKFEGGDLKVEHRLVPYDVEAAADKIRRAGLPRFLADRLFRGF